MRLAIGFLALALAAVQAEEVNLTTLRGRKIEKAELSRVEPDGIVLTTDTGIEKIPFTALSPELQTKYGFDPIKAAQFKAEIAKAAAERQKIQAATGRFAGWDAALRDAQKTALDNQSVVATAGGSVSEWQAKSEALIADFQKKYDAMKELIAESDQAGTPADKTQQIIDSVLEGKIFLGMPKAFLLLSWGQPKKIERALTEAGSSENWWFGRGKTSAEVSVNDSGVISYIGE